MKRRFTVVAFAILAIAALTIALPGANAENYGQIRALKRRALTVQRQKNAFVARVLESYAIPHQQTSEGIVSRLQIGGRWRDVSRIEIVPVVQQTRAGLQVVAQEIFFFTEGEVLHLVSALTIR
jgi:hypothetical protein